MYNNIQWANYTEEEPDLLCMPQIGQLGLVNLSHTKGTVVLEEEEFSNHVFSRVKELF